MLSDHRQFYYNTCATKQSLQDITTSFHAYTNIGKEALPGYKHTETKEQVY